jgi:hypothetical protein
MGDIGSGGGSSYPTALDTQSSQEVNSPNAGKTKARAEVPNDLAAAIIAIETELGTDPAGTLTDVKTFNQTEHQADGTHGAITPTSIVNAGTTEATGTVKYSKGNDIASAGALTLGADGNYFDITGTTTVTSITTIKIGTVVKLHFDAILTLTHHATDLVLPGGANITTAAGDEAEFIEYATGDWRCTNYQTAADNPNPGQLIQVVNVQDGAVATGTTISPDDDTIPQNTEGDEYMTLAITPTSATSKLMIDIVFNSSQAGDLVSTLALFQDTTADSLAAVTFFGHTAFQRSSPTSFKHYMTSGTTSSTTFKVRAGLASPGGTLTFNGNGGARKLGGVMASSITISEIAA